jgi:hypothetical protein
LGLREANADGLRPAALCALPRGHDRAAAGAGARQSGPPRAPNVGGRRMLGGNLPSPSLSVAQTGIGDYSMPRTGMCSRVRWGSADDPQPCPCGGLDAPGLPLRMPQLLGMPFVLTTPGGQPVGRFAREANLGSRNLSEACVSLNSVVSADTGNPPTGSDGGISVSPACRAARAPGRPPLRSSL